MWTDFYWALLAGCALDLLLGDPAWLYHPVCIIGKYISWCEKKLRARGGDLRRSAVLLTASTVLITTAAAGLLVFLSGLLGRVPRLIVMALLDWMGLSAKCLAQEAVGVEKALGRGIEAGRRQVARIVGRDTAALSEREVVCATIETVAENTTDGIISPMVYGLLGGPVCMWAFKASSTLDSMVGYLDEKYRDIGWSSAKLDDVWNYLPARLTGCLLSLGAALCGLDGKSAFRIMRRDHRNHKSPNCAWSEAAAAGALHVQLGGTHLYFGKPVAKPTIGDDLRAPKREDIRATVRMMYAASGLMLALQTILVWVAGVLG